MRLTDDWRSLSYTSPGVWRPFQLCRRVANNRWLVTLPIWRAITPAEVVRYHFWRPAC